MQASARTHEVSKTIPTEPLAAFGDLLNVDDMMKLLNVSGRTIYRMCEREELPYRKIGRRLYFPKHELIEFLDLEEYCVA